MGTFFSPCEINEKTKIKEKKKLLLRYKDCLSEYTSTKLVFQGRKMTKQDLREESEGGGNNLWG